MNEQNEIFERYAKVPYLLAQKFSNEYDEVMLQYPSEMKIEITQHLEQLMTLFRDEPETCFSNIGNAEMLFLEKYGSALKPYRDKGFHKYFDTDLVLAEKDIFTVEEWNKLPPEIQSLSPDITGRFISVCINQLITARLYLYLERETGISPNLEAGTNINDSSSSSENINANGFTKARQLLAVYFLLQSLGVKHRGDAPLTSTAKLIHLISGTPFTTIQNSDIYKKYRAMPHYKKGKELMADLNFIRPFFEAVNLKSVLQLIDEELDGLKKRK
jgi:hypothetical protein